MYNNFGWCGWNYVSAIIGKAEMGSKQHLSPHSSKPLHKK